jgi:multiple antibiotic resistance protein
MVARLDHLRTHEERGIYSGCVSLLLITLAASVIYFICMNFANAAEITESNFQTKEFTLSHIWTFLFLMLGPFKIIGPFAKITKETDATFTFRIAMLAIGFSSLALLIAAILGESILNSYSIPMPVLALSAGIILFLVALQSVIQQFSPGIEHDAGNDTSASLNMALMPLAFPTIVTPYGIAALVVFTALSPDFQSKLIIGGIVLAIMLLNFLVMVLTRHILPAMRVLLPILGAVLGVVQVALGLQIINNSLRAMGIL